MYRRKTNNDSELENRSASLLFGKRLDQISMVQLPGNFSFDGDSGHIKCLKKRWSCRCGTQMRRQCLATGERDGSMGGFGCASDNNSRGCGGL